MTAGPHHDFNDAISIVVTCESQACGWLIDKFGVRWQIVPAMLDDMMRGADRRRSKRVADAMLGMIKLDIAALKKAYRAA